MRFDNCNEQYSAQLYSLTCHDYQLFQRIAYYMHINGKVLSDQYSPDEIVQLNDTQMTKYTESYATDQYQKYKENIYRSLVDHDFLKEQGIQIKGCIKCRFCQHTELDVEIKQTRSADEGSTTFLTCRRCGKRCKM